MEAFHQYCATHRLNTFLPIEHLQFSASKPSTQCRTPDQYAKLQAPDAIIGPAPEKRKRRRPATLRATEAIEEDANAKEREHAGQSGAAQQVYLTAEAIIIISEERGQGSSPTGCGDDAQGITQPTIDGLEMGHMAQCRIHTTRATRGQLDTLRAIQERTQVRHEDPQRHDDTVKPLQEITAIVNYVDAEKWTDHTTVGPRHSAPRHGDGS